MTKNKVVDRPDRQTSLRRLKHWDSILAKLEEEPKLLNMYEWSEKCGTVGCAAGHAAMDQTFIDEGLHIEEGGELPECCLKPPWWCSSGRYVSWGINAVSWFFGLTREQAEHICLPEKYDINETKPYPLRIPISPEKVRKHIGDVIRSIEEPP